MAVPAHDQRDLDFARAFGLPVRVVVDTGEPTRPRPASRPPGDGVLVNSGPLDGLTQGRGDPHDHRPAGGRRASARRAVTYRLRDWLLSRQRYWGCPIPIVHCPDCGEVAGARRPAAGELPDLSGHRPGAQGHLAAGRGDRLGQRRRARPAAARPSGTPTRWTPSSTRPGTSCATARPADDRRPVRPRGGPRAGCRSTSTSAASSTRSCTCCTARFFTKVLHDMGMVDFDEPFTRLLNQGQVINQGKAMSKSLGNGVDLGDQIDALRRRRRPADRGLRRAAGGGHRLGRRLARRFGEVPGSAPTGWPATCSAPGADPATGDVALRQATHRPLADIDQLIESSTVQRGRRPGHGAGQRHPQGDRLRRRSPPTRPSARPPRSSPWC